MRVYELSLSVCLKLVFFWAGPPSLPSPDPGNESKLLHKAKVNHSMVTVSLIIFRTEATENRGRIHSSGSEVNVEWLKCFCADCLQTSEAMSQICPSQISLLLYDDLLMAAAAYRGFSVGIVKKMACCRRTPPQNVTVVMRDKAVRPSYSLCTSDS